MSVNLNVINNLSIVTQGSEVTGKQGAITDDPKTPYSIALNGFVEKNVGQIATATATKIWASANDNPSTIAYFHFWADQDCYLQLIATATNVVIPILANTPFCLSKSSILAAANTTPITGGATPTATAIESIYVGNYSGTTLNFAWVIVN